MNKDSFEWHALNDYKICRSCQKKLLIHAYRSKRSGKKEVVYAHCTNKGCSLYGVETPPHDHGGKNVQIKESIL